MGELSMKRPPREDVVSIVRRIPSLGEAAGVVARWPVDLGLCALVSSPAADRESSRWSVLAAPSGSPIDFAEIPAWDALGRIGCGADLARDAHAPPFVGGWIGWLGYALGTDFEPTAQCATKPAPDPGGRGWLTRCDTALVRDEDSGEWFLVGDERAGDELLDRLRGDHAPAECEVGEFRSVQGRAAYEAAVARTVEYIHAGDVFQANIAHELRAPFIGSPRAAFLRMMRSAAPAFGALLEPPPGVRDTRVVCSISPELFLDADFPRRTVRTRPIKGTRSASEGASTLLESEKDAAELAMIVDLMRNDLSRVCEPGTVRVERERSVERHGGGGVLHAVAEVAGTMRGGTGVRELIRAAFPPGSVTGAPKIRAMQIIDELEPFARDAYCGAIGFVSDSGAARLSVAIRTATIERERNEIVYPVGAGIVAESDPAREWEETLTKAEAITRAFAHGAGR